MESNSIQYEAYQAGHLEGIVRLCAVEGWSSYEDAETTSRAFTAPGSIVVVALDGQEAVGFIQMLTDGVVHAHISNIVVSPTHRRRGIGRELVQRAFEKSGARYVDMVSTGGSQNFSKSFEYQEFPGVRIYPRPSGN